MIESKENKKIKYISKLRNNKFIEKEKKFIVEGEHLVKEAYDTGFLEETYSLYDTDYDVPNNIIDKKIMDYLSILPSKSNILGICKCPPEKNILGNKLIILDNVQDPGNLGTIIRSARAFNFDTIILGDTCVKKYNDKVIRSSQGMVFKSNILSKKLSDFIPYLIKNNYDVYGTDVNNGEDVKKLKKTEKIAIVMGNEGTGLSDEIKDMLDKNIYIKTSNYCESLNVSVAASIIMYELGKGE